MDNSTAATTEIYIHSLPVEFPSYSQEALTRYIYYGIPPGSFLRAVLTNDLLGAFKNADAWNLPLIERYVQYFDNHLPSLMWGSKDNYHDWVFRDQDQREQILKQHGFTLPSSN